MEEKPLTKQYLWKVWGFIAFNITVFWIIFISNNLRLESVGEVLNQLTLEKGIIASIAPLITIILNGILPSSVKAILVFWRIKNPLPGTRIFTELAEKDQRIDLNVIKKKHQELPDDPAEQNRLWYKIYKSHHSKTSIFESHKVFLLTRDLASVSFVFLFLFSLAAILFFGEIKLVYIIFLILQYLVFSIVSRNYGNRFVCNVLAEESV